MSAPVPAAHDLAAVVAAFRSGLAGSGAPSVAPPRIALFAGPSAGYPYAAFYAHALWCLGLTFRRVDARAIAAGALDDADVLVVPGGFAIWGLAQAEGAPGADDAVRAYLERGGGAIGSCGGAYYLSAGRPGWTGTANVKPVFTNEYLQTGAAIVNVALTDEALGRGLPPTIEMPYYHGPVWPDAGTNAKVLARFAELACPSRLMIDNPLERERFEALLRDRPAALYAEGRCGRAVLFSGHPEMGDLVRRAVALDGYVRKYLPLRGAKVMAETLRFTAPEESPSYRLILNAMTMLGVAGGKPRCLVPAAEAAETCVDAIANLVAVATGAFSGFAARLDAVDESEGFRALVRDQAMTLEAEARDVFARLARGIEPDSERELAVALAEILREAAAALAGLDAMPVPQALLMLDLPVRLGAAALRVAELDHRLRVGNAEP